MRIYNDGVFDVIHRGHIEFFKLVKKLYPSSYLIVGVISDKDVESYKRIPIYSEDDRYEIINSIKYVDEVIFKSPMIINEEFIKDKKLDLMVHAFSNIKEKDDQMEKYFQPSIKLNIFKELPYYNKISTTQIINKIKKSR